MDKKPWENNPNYWKELLVDKGQGCTICGLRFIGQPGHGPPCYGHEAPKKKK